MRLAFLLLWMAGCQGGGDSTAVGIASLLDQMADLDHLARLPSPRFVTRQASSYDRASVAPDQPGWFANRDRGNFVREETTDGRHEFVMLDVDGPGAVVRLWSADPRGTLRLYVDGAKQPALSARMESLLDGDDPLFPSPLAHVAARGHNLYYPFPFARHCKITTDEPADLYYQIDYRVYAAQTRVESFTLSRALAASTKVARVVERLDDPPEPDGGPRQLTLAPGQPVTIVASSPSGGVLRELVAAVGGRSAEQLRGTVVVMRFDGEETVRAPVDVLFGSGPGLNPFRTLPLDASVEGRLRSRWPMPFHERAELELASGGPLAISLRVESWRFGDDSLYFHARWHAPDDLPTSTPRDWNLITIEGQGQYVGNTLDARYFQHSWWGEGDEKIWIDGETFPGWFGTGTEDYYGYAWCSNRKFSHAYHAQTRADGPISENLGRSDGFGRTSVNRFHVLDPIPFDQRFRFDLEVLDWPHNSHLMLDAVAYYYARPRAHDNLRPITPADLLLAP